MRLPLYLLLSTLLCVGCGSTTEFVAHETRVEDHLINVDVPDVHVTLQGVIKDSVIVATTPDSVKKRPWVRTHTNIHTGVVQVDVLMPDTTIVDRDTTQVTSTTVVEKPGFFDQFKTGILLACLLVFVVGVSLGGIKLAKMLKII
jgi:hypothetical protein